MSIETVLDPTNVLSIDWTFWWESDSRCHDCYLEFKDVPLSVPGQVRLDICPKGIDGL